MVKIHKKLTKVNFTASSNKKNEWVVIHFVGAVSTAKNNADYFYSVKRGASANDFVDENEIWHVVEYSDIAWHVGGAKTYYNACRNNNSIGIEMCCKKNASGEWYIEPKTIENTIELVKDLMQKYNIPLDHVVRHYDVTHKVCPEPFVRNPEQWKEFLRRLEADSMNDEVSLQEKEQEIMKYYNLDNNTISYFEFYRYNIALIDKLYYRTKNH